MNCSVCQEPASATCGGCGVTRYCTLEHQRLDWKIHKPKCFPYKIVTEVPSATNGQTLGAEQSGVNPDKEIRCGIDGRPLTVLNQRRHMIATRDLKPGMLLWEEPAVFQGPLGVNVLRKTCGLDNLYICISCGADLKVMQQLNQSTVCSNCNWPACSIECAQNPAHFAECELFAKAQNANSKRVNPTLEEIFLLGLISRGANLKLENPLLFEHMVELYKANDLSGTISAWASEDMVKILKFFLEVPELEFEDHVYKMMFQLVRMYGYAYHYNFWGDRSNRLQRTKMQQQLNLALYNKASYLTHACFSNCTWTIGPPPSYSIRIITSVPIKKGEKLTASRSLYPDENSHGTPNRQSFLRNTSISCSCQRCMDPSELQTFSSALVCQICRKNEMAGQTHYLLPRDPCSSDPDALWICNNPNCSHQIEQDEAIKITDQAKQEVDNLQTQPLRQMSNEQRESRTTIIDPEVGYKNAEIFGRNLLHPNHWVLLEPLRILVVGENLLCMPVATSLAGFDSNIRRIEQCLEIETKIHPGISQQQSFIQFKLVLLLGAKLEFFRAFMNKDQIVETCQRIQALAKEALKFFKHDFPGHGKTSCYIALQLMELHDIVPERQLGEKCNPQPLDHSNSLLYRIYSATRQ